MRRALFAAASGLALVGGALPARAAAYTFAPIVGPVGSSTAAHAVNDLGQVLGSGGQIVNYYGTTFDNPISPYFIETAGTVTSISDYNYSSQYNAINNNGQTLRSAFTGSVDQTFIDNGLINSISNPHATIKTIQPDGLVIHQPLDKSFFTAYGGFIGLGFNDLGQTVGFIYYYTSGPRGQNYSGNGGGIYSNGVLSEFLAPNPGDSGYHQVYGPDGTGLGGPTGINNAGQIVGFDGILGGGFLDTAGVFTPVAVPGADPRSTSPLAISNAGVIAGSYTDATGTHGFVDNNGVYTRILGSDISGMPLTGLDYTTITGINVAGDLVGNSNNSSSGAFFATPTSVPVPEPGSAMLLGASLAGLGFVLRRGRLRPTRPQ